MSLTVVLKGIDGLVLAADSRITKGYNLEGPKTRDDSEKFVQLNDNCGALTYGFSDIGNTGISSLKNTVLKNNESYQSLGKLLDKATQIFTSVNSDWSKVNSGIIRRDKDVGFILAGYNSGNNKFEIYNLLSPQFSPKKLEKGSLMAGQWHISRFLVNRLYNEDMPVFKLKDLAVLLLKETMTVDKTVGGIIHLATVTKSKGFQWILEDEVKSILERAEVFCNFFKEQLYSSMSRALK